MISWITENNLGSITQGVISELKVEASQITYESSELKYKITGGSLPSGLNLLHDGTISGKISYETTGTYTFTTTVVDSINSESTSTNFNLSITTSPAKYTRAYFTALFNLQKREQFRQFILNEQIFNPSTIYRYWDQNFGVQTKLKMFLEFGLEQVNLQEYAYALRENFYRKRLFLNNKPKIAFARDSSGNVVYEAIYLDVVDELTNNSVSAKPAVYSVNEEVYYPGSIDNMKLQLRTIVLDDYTYIKTDDNLQPRFMLTQEQGNFRTDTYLKVVPLCYALPGKGAAILDKIKSSNFKFNTLDFEIDRLIIENSKDNTTDKYLIFERQAIGHLIESDPLIYGSERWVRIDTENDEPLERE